MDAPSEKLAYVAIVPAHQPVFRGRQYRGLKKRLAPFMAMPLSGPGNYHGPTLRQTHARLASMGLDDGVFGAFLRHFGDVLREPGVPAEKIAEIMPISYRRAAFLNR